MLATISRGDTVGVALVDLPATPRPMALGEAAVVGVSALKSAGWSVDGLVNLDVGSFNILAATNGTEIRNLGSLTTESAHNVVVLYAR